MCFSATVSYSAAALLVGTGLHAIRQPGRPLTPYLMWALVPVFFGVQQAFEGLVWQALDAGNPAAAVPFALGFHFFSHFLWLWWLPLGSYLAEPGESALIGKNARLRKRVIAGCTIFGAFAGTLVYAVMLLHPEWMSVAVREHSIVYDFSVPYDSPLPFRLPVTPVTLYGLTILVPLFISSHWRIRIFGGLVVISMALASAAFNQTFVSVWCFFAAMLSLYFIYMIRHLAAESR